MSKKSPDPKRKRSRIFISYRRQDSRARAASLYRDLKRYFGDEHVFMDISGIEGGEDFVRVLEERLDSCQVLVAVIGNQWLNLIRETGPAHAGEADWVRLEISTALEKRMPVIPVLVDDATMPLAQDLPEALKHLARRQAVVVRDDQWDLDLARLIRILEQAVPRAKGIALPIMVTLALIATLFLGHYFATVPQTMRLDADSKIIPPALLGDELVIEGPIVNTVTGQLLSVEAPPLEDIRVDLEKAQVSHRTMSEFELDPRSSSDFEAITYSSADPEEKSVSSRPCTTSLELGTKDGKLPSAIHFSQLWGKPEEGGSTYRVLDLKSVGADLFIVMSTNPQDSPGSDGTSARAASDDNGPGCLKNLTTSFGDRPLLAALRTVESTVAQDSRFHFRFSMLPNAPEPLWRGEGAFEPFAVRGLQAHAVRIKRPGSDNILDVQSVGEKNLLRIDSLTVEPRQLRVSVSGQGFVKLYDEDAVHLGERIRAHKLQAGSLALVTITLITWLAFLVRRFFPGRR